MASVRVNMRIPRDVWTAVSAYAEERESNNTAVVVAALRGFLDDAGRGVPELEEAVESRRAPGPVSKEPQLSSAAPPPPRAPAGMDWQEIEMARRKARR